MLLKLRKQNSLVRGSWKKNSHKVMYKGYKERVAVSGRNIQRQEGKKASSGQREVVINDCLKYT